MSEIKACGIVLCSLVVCIVFKNLKSEYSLFIRILITTGIFGVSLGMIYPVLNYIEEISKNTAIYKYIPILFKALGISFAIQITSDICVDAQENSLSERICFFGKVEILVISLPLVKEVLALCENVLK